MIYRWEGLLFRGTRARKGCQERVVQLGRDVTACASIRQDRLVNLDFQASIKSFLSEDINDTQISRDGIKWRSISICIHFLVASSLRHRVDSCKWAWRQGLNSVSNPSPKTRNSPKHSPKRTSSESAVSPQKHQKVDPAINTISIFKIPPNNSTTINWAIPSHHHGRRPRSR